MALGIADSLATLRDRFGRFFRIRRRDNANFAEQYLSGFVQAEDCTFAAMATMVDNSCAQQDSVELRTARLAYGKEVVTIFGVANDHRANLNRVYYPCRSTTNGYGFRL